VGIKAPEDIRTAIKIKSRSQILIPQSADIQLGAALTDLSFNATVLPPETQMKKGPATAEPQSNSC